MMKSKLLLIALLSFLVYLPAQAAITVEDTSSVEYLENNDYSDTMVEMIQTTKAQMSGQKYITKDEIKHANDSKFVKWVRRTFMYVDPALDDGWMMHHNIKVTPQFDDL